MSRNPDPNRLGSSAPNDGVPAAVRVLAGILALEALGVGVVTVVLVVQTLTTPATSLVSGIALIVLAALTAVGLAAVAVATWRGRRWVRSAAVVWQIVQLGVGFYAFQGEQARPDLGALLVVPAVVALGLLMFSPGVAELSTRPD